jgi:poly(glycerol-phosphate) alpha-glucosyltransferase
MKYFVSRSIYTFNSGVEHSQANRTLMFNALGDQAKYVTRDYNRLWVRDAERVGLNSTNVLNMYDFFQGTCDVERVQLPVREFKQLSLTKYQLVEHGADYSTLDHAGRQIARINILPGTVGLVGDIEYYDRFETIVSRENFDWRGFKSSIDYFHPDGALGVRRFLNQAGDVVLENIYMNIEGQLQPTMWKLINYHGQDYRFNTEDQLFLFFLNEAMKQTDNNVIVSDHREIDYVVADVENVDTKWVAFHGNHIDQGGTPFAAYSIALQIRAQDFDGIIVPTSEQQQELVEKFPELNVQVAPDVAINSELVEAKPVWLRDRTEGRIIFSGRLEADKRPMEALRAFFQVLEQVPNASMEFRGYTNDQNLLNEMKTMVEQRGVQERVIFGNYLTNNEMQSFYDSAQVIVNTSISEAAGMNLIEAMAHGIPVVSFDTKYGLHDLIEKDVNGYIVTNGDHAQMARRIQKMLTDNVLWAKLSKQAYAKAKEYSFDEVYQKWHAILK